MGRAWVHDGTRVAAPLLHCRAATSLLFAALAECFMQPHAAAHRHGQKSPGYRGWRRRPRYS
eukprot:1161080-Pelagomonas_calceolata.AAC.3